MLLSIAKLVIKRKAQASRNWASGSQDEVIYNSWLPRDLLLS